MTTPTSNTSRTIVRQGIAAYFGGTYDTFKRGYTGGPIPMLGIVRAAYPKRIDLHDAFLNGTEGQMSGSWITVQLPRVPEVRRTMAGAPVTQSGTIIAGGWKQQTYEVVLDGFFVSQQSFGEDAQADFDTLAENILEQLRYDRTLGGICLDAGETRRGVVTEEGHPAMDENDRIGIDFQISFEARVNIVA